MKTYKKVLSFLILSILSVFLFAITTSAKDITYTSINGLPTTRGNVITEISNTTNQDVGIATFTKKTSSNKIYYDIKIEYNGKEYYITSNLPVNSLVKNEFKGYYYTMEVNGKINKFLYYDFISKNYEESQHVNIAIQQSLGQKEVQPFLSRVIWNLTTGEYEVRDKVNVYGATRWSKSKRAYFLDVVIDIPTDKLVLVELNYRWNNIHWFGIRGKEFQDSFTYLFNDMVIGYNYYGKPNTINNKDLSEEYKKQITKAYLDRLVDEYYNQSLNSPTSITISKEDIRRQIEQANTPYGAIEYITGEDTSQSMLTQNAMPAPTAQRNEFVARVNGATKNALNYYNTHNISFKDKPIIKKYVELQNQGGFASSDIFTANSDGKIYTMPLKKQSGVFTLSTEFKDFAIINIVYMTNGKLIHLSKSQIDTFIPDHVHTTVLDKVGSFFKNIFNFFKKYIWIVYVVGGLVGAYFILKFTLPFIKTTTKRGKRKTYKKPRKRRK